MKSFYRASGMPKNRCGFGAIFNNTINVCKYHHELFENTDILIDNLEINNLFETKSVSDKEEFSYDLEKSYNSSNYSNHSNAHAICDIESVKEKNKIFNLFFKLKNIEFYEKETLKYIDDKTLAIQIRGTDKKTEIPRVNLEKIFCDIDTMMIEFDLETIFLSTDDIFYTNALKSRYEHQLKYRIDKKISLNGNPLHFIEDRELLNKELMMDVYLLSKSKYFLYCFSNVSYLALTLGINNFKKIKCINEN